MSCSRCRQLEQTVDILRARLSQLEGSGPRLVPVEEVHELFDYWRERCDHPLAKLTAERVTKIRARRRDGYTVEFIKQAIDGAAVAPFVNEQGRRFDDLELICRNGTKLESFAGRAAAAHNLKTLERKLVGS
jgi:hypothetical protein